MNRKEREKKRKYRKGRCRKKETAGDEDAKKIKRRKVMRVNRRMERRIKKGKGWKREVN